MKGVSRIVKCLLLKVWIKQHEEEIPRFEPITIEFTVDYSSPTRVTIKSKTLPNNSINQQ